MLTEIAKNDTTVSVGFVKKILFRAVLVACVVQFVAQIIAAFAAL